MTKLFLYALVTCSIVYFSKACFDANIVNLSVEFRWAIAIFVASAYTLVLTGIFYLIVLLIEEIK